ncbi:MAG: hypothetical protein Tsb0013_15900 [Phycisphaerales bacterium]
MTRTLAIVIAIAFVVQPLLAAAAHACGCAPSDAREAQLVSDSPACCGCTQPPGSPASTPTDSDHDNDPCEGCACPKACCAIAKTIGTLGVSPAFRPAPPRIERRSVPAQDPAACAHVDELTRPPRQTPA